MEKEYSKDLIYSGCMLISLVARYKDKSQCHKASQVIQDHQHPVRDYLGLLLQSLSDG